MRITLLGAMQVDLGSGPIATGGVKQRALLAQLCRHPNRPVSIDALAEGIWGEQVPDRYRQNIQVYVSTWRRALDPARPPGAQSRIIGHREAYELVAAPDEIDVSEYLRAATEGGAALDGGRPDAAATTLGRALEIWRGDPLVDLTSQPFAADWVTELEQHRLEVLGQRIDADLACGRHGSLVAELTGLVDAHPHLERFWGQLAVALYRTGRQADALAVLARARRELLEELGVDPGPGLRDIERQILDHDPQLVASPPVTTLTASVPLPLTRAIGRDGLCDELVGLVELGERLIVLTGPGGVGKTRTALEVARRLDSTCRVVWTPLADTEDVGDAMEVIESCVRDTPDALLFVDNLEQLPGIGVALRSLLERTPGLRILATSRAPLGVAGEHVIQVPALTDQDAAALFSERARAIDPTLDLVDHRDSIVQLCRSLDGLPLAIELAAARSRTFSPDELASELMGSDPDDADVTAGRHSSLSNAVRWSVRLLSPADRRLFARLSVYDGVFDRAVAQALGDGTDGASVEALVNVALLRPVETAAGRRFSMLATVRAVAQSLPDGDEVVDLAAVADLFVARERTIDPICQPDRARLADVGANLPMTRRVLAHLVATGRGSDAAAILMAQRRAVAVLGRQDEMLSMANGLLEAGLADRDAARISIVAGGAAYSCGAPEAATLLAAVHAVAPEDPIYRVLGWSWLCVLAADEAESDPARHDDARSHARRAIEAADSDPLHLIARSAAAWAAQSRGDHAEAVEHAERQLGYAQDDSEAAQALFDLSLAQMYADQTNEAHRSAADAVAAAMRLGPSVVLSNAQRALGETYLRQGDPVQSLVILAAALDDSGSRSDLHWGIEIVACIGLAAVMTGRRDEGLALMARADAHARRVVGSHSALPEYLSGTASEHGVAERPLRPATDLAQELFDDAVAVSRNLTTTQRPQEQSESRTTSTG